MPNIIPLRAFTDNYIWTLLAGNQAWVVDPGDATPVLEFLASQEKTLAGILLTHHHADHSGGIAKLLAHAGDIPVYGSHHSRITEVNQRLQEGDVFTAAGIEFRAIEIPSHTLDHIAFYGDNILFSGDTLFCAGCGRVFEGTPAMMYHSLSKLAALPAETKLYCGHEYTIANLRFAKRVEPSNSDITDKISAVTKLVTNTGCSLPSTLQEEKKINPFLRCEIPDVIHAVEEHAQQKSVTPVEVFHVLREWKNSY